MILHSRVVVAVTLGAAVALTLGVAHYVAPRQSSANNGGQSASSEGTRSISGDLAHARVVVKVHVDSVGSATWTSPDGSAPDLQMLRSTPYQITPVTPLQLTVGQVYKGARSDVPATFWIPGGNPPVGPGRLYSSVSSSATIPGAGSDLIMFLGDSIDWRHGYGDPEPARGLQQLCTVSGSGAACEGYSLSNDQLRAALGR